MKNFSKVIPQPWREILVWVFVFFLLLLMDWRHVDDMNSIAYRIVLLRSFIIIGSLGAVFYINKLILIPFLYFKQKSQAYFLATLVLLFANVTLFANLEWYFIFPEIEKVDSEVKRGFPIMFHMLFDTFAIYISTFTEVTRHNQKEKETQQALVAENAEVELKFLKSQINPHFLFNALNNIYTLSYIKSEKAPDVVLQLSDMLRYQIYDCSDDHVEIGKEVEYLKNYIEFQNLKTEEDLNITFNTDCDDLLRKISPFLFIPFIENAFKHSGINDYGGFVNIEIGLKKNKLTLNLGNSLPNVTIKDNDERSGIGMENVKKRLELTYPGRYTLEYGKKENSYLVSLTIDLPDENA